MPGARAYLDALEASNEAEDDCIPFAQGG